MNIDSNQYTIFLQIKGDCWRWKRSDGEFVSPVFSTLQAALDFGAKNPFFTDKEWKEHISPNYEPEKSIGHKIEKIGLLTKYSEYDAKLILDLLNEPERAKALEQFGFNLKELRTICELSIPPTSSETP